MIDQTRIEKIIKRLLKSSPVEERQAVKPSREWALGILLTLVGVGVGGAVSYVSYLNTVSVEVVAPAVVEPATYSGVVAEEAAIRFRERAARFAALRGDASVPVQTPIEPVSTTTETELPSPTETVIEPLVPEVPVEETSASELDNQTPQLSF